MDAPRSAPIRLTIEVDPNADPVSGWVDTMTPQSGQTEFTGWTEFSMAVEACIARARAARADTSDAAAGRHQMG
jgi:hypothetical protein